MNKIYMYAMQSIIKWIDYWRNVKLSKKKIIDEYDLLFLGLTTDKDNIYKIFKRRKTYKNEKEYEDALNELAEYIFEGDRKVVYHSFRQFPYIEHLKQGEGKGTLEYYTVADIVFICLVLEQQRYVKKGIEGISVDNFKELTQKKVKVSDCPITDIPAEYLLKPLASK